MKKYIILLFIGIVITANAQYIMLDVDGILADEENWCWAAASQCILDYYGDCQYRQCDIAEFVRTSGTTFHNYGTIPCCTNPNFGCTQGNSLNAGRGSIQDILCELGSIVSRGAPYLSKDGIIDRLEQRMPFVIGLQSPDYSKAHVYVSRGIDGDRIYFVDPDDDDDGIKDGYGSLSYNVLLSNAKYVWYGTLITDIARGVPCCCNNGAWDADKGEEWIDCGDVCGVACSGGVTPEDYCSNRIKDGDETGIDCGGKLCPQCTPCNNCKLDPGEDAIDCGGSCPPCTYVGGITDEKNITTTAQLTSEVMAFNKITAGGTTTVASGKDVIFITEPTGSIVLLPGFKAEEGSTFKTQRKNLNKRLCGAICHGQYLSHHHSAMTSAPVFLEIYNLLYAVEIDYQIYNVDIGLIYNYTLDITSNGTFKLWDCRTGTVNPKGTVWYSITYTVLYCDGDAHVYRHNFYVNYPSSKSLNEDPDPPETPPLFSPPPLNDTPLPSATATPNLVIIPNPNPGTFQIETNFPLANIGNLKITNLMGATVYETQKVASNTVQLQNPSSGTFFVVMILKDGAVLTRKMVVR